MQDDTEFLVCQICGRSDETVRDVIDPYNQDVNDDEVEMTLCPDCRQDRADDV